MSSISFSEFARKARSLFPHETQGGYIKILLGEITDFSKDEEGNPLHTYRLDTLSKFYNGSPFRVFAGKIFPFLDVDKFADYVEGRSFDTREKVREALSDFLSQTQSREFPRACAELFANIIKAESEGHPYSIDDNIQNQLSLMLPVQPEDDADYLKAECDNRCLLCGKRLKEKTVMEIVPSSTGIPIRAEVNDKLKHKGVKELPDLNGNYDTHSVSNRVLVHPNCATKYMFKPDANQISDLYIKKQAAQERLMLQDTLDNLEVDEALGELLGSIDDLIDPEAIEELRYKPEKLSNKIYPEHTTLLFDVRDKVLCYFGFIQKSLSTLKYSKGYTFKDLAHSVKRCFTALDSLEMNQQEIYYEMTNWVSEKTGCKNLIACQILISFFVQDCEVFNEITE